ncbi:GDSL esterase/lipase At5g03600-like [Phragmites australis]|uniref:GDSL esterase/lipase At5g03600-like n=1 Tax=Phragmites australis TaxID=29695 RepID=UPI002D790783|nr:GDSL esterase/lipase At5g03600-like [Phragmites australis]
MKILFAGCFLVLLLNVAHVECRVAPVESRRHDDDSSPDRLYKLFIFGDSIADDGNVPNPGLNRGSRAWYYPYGMSDDDHDNSPTGRFSNNMVQSDFLAKILGHDESPPPYAAHKARRGKKSNRINSSGMNFANASSGAVYLVPTLGAQIDQFSSLVSDGVITERDLDESVALVAYSGRYYGRISNSASDDYIARFAEDVTEEIAGIVKQLQELGVPKVLVNSVPPLGCTPWMSRFTNYDHCDKRGNMISDAHNTALLDKLGKEKNVMLLDVNTMFTELVSPKPGSTLSKQFKYMYQPCCESIDASGYCGQYDGNRPLFRLCRNPDEYFYWDYIHPTHAGWKAVMQLLQGPIMAFLGISNLNHF